MLNKRLDRIIVIEFIVVVCLFILGTNIATDYLPFYNSNPLNQSVEKSEENLNIEPKNLAIDEPEVLIQPTQTAEINQNLNNELVLQNNPVQNTVSPTPTAAPSIITSNNSIQCVDLIGEGQSSSKMSLDTESQVISFVQMKYLLETTINVKSVVVSYKNEEINIWNASWQMGNNEVSILLMNNTSELSIINCPKSIV